MCPAVCETGEWCKTQTWTGVLLFSFILMSFLSSCTKKGYWTDMGCFETKVYYFLSQIILKVPIDTEEWLATEA